MSVNTDVTIVIKTFERPECLKRLVASIRRYYPLIKIIIADDSKSPATLQDENIEICTMPFASGNSKGRNFAVARVKTKYFMTLDDDFIFTEKTSLRKRYDILETTDIDLVGSNVDDGQKRPGMLIRIVDKSLYRWPGSNGSSSGYQLYDYVPQCFMARTRQFADAGGWDDDFLVWDHLVLFLRLLGKLKITMIPEVDILHRQESGKLYKEHRWGVRLQRDRQLLTTKYGLIEKPPLMAPREDK